MCTYYFRFICMIAPMLQNPDTVQTIVSACCILHNVLIDMDPRALQGLIDVEDPTTHDVRPGAWRQEMGLLPLHVTGGHTSHTDGKVVREYLTKYYNSNAGSVPWQDAMI